MSNAQRFPFLFEILPSKNHGFVFLGKDLVWISYTAVNLFFRQFQVAIYGLKCSYTTEINNRSSA